MNMRRFLLAAVLVVVLGGAAATAILLYVLCGDGPSSGAMEPLPDSLLKFDSEPEKRESLLAEAKEMLENIPKPLQGSMLVQANCRVAKERLDREYGSEDASPFAVGASIVPIRDRTFLFLLALDTPREMQAVILEGRTRDGAALRVVYHIEREFKDVSLVVWRGWPMQQVDIDELLQSKLTFRSIRSPSLVEVQMRNDGGPWLVPNTPDLVLAIRDRSGGASNFVAVVNKSHITR